MKYSNKVHPVRNFKLMKSHFTSRKEDFEYNFKDVLYMLFCCFKPKPDVEVEPESFEERYQKFMSDNSKLSSAIDITNIISDIRELRVMIDQLKSSRTDQTTQKEPKIHASKTVKVNDGNLYFLKICFVFSNVLSKHYFLK